MNVQRPSQDGKTSYDIVTGQWGDIPLEKDNVIS